MAIREYGGQLFITDLAISADLGTPDRRIGKPAAIRHAVSVAKRILGGSSMGQWVLAHPRLKIEVERDASMRGYEVNYNVWYDADVEVVGGE